MFSFFLLQLLFEVGVAQHVVLAETVHLEVRVIRYFESLVHYCLLDLDLLRHLLIHQFFYLLLAAFDDVGLL